MGNYYITTPIYYVNDEPHLVAGRVHQVAVAGENLDQGMMTQ